MALFQINRYLGDEEEDSRPDSESRSKALLSKLQQRAKARLQLQRTESHVTEELTDRPSDERKQEKPIKEKTELQRSKKKRKTSIKEHDDEDDPGDVAASTTEDQPRKKRKKKKDKNAVDGGQIQEAEDGSTVGSEAAAETETSNGDEKKESEISSLSSSFHVLGGFETKTPKKVQRVLPKWLAEPNVFERDVKNNQVPLSDVTGICTVLKKKLEANGIQTLFPVQAEVIPAILESVTSGFLVGRGGYRPRDICVSAPTGSGKTLVFVIPVIQALMTRVVCEVRALVVLPTKELAQQVYKVFCVYAEGTGLKVGMAAGQKSFAVEQASLNDMRGGIRRSLVDILVATPGRLVDHINKNQNFTLQHLRFLIVDEVDRMIDSMQQSWLSQVTKAVYKNGGTSETSIFKRTEPGPVTVSSLFPPQMPLQKLLFSATLTQNPEKLQQLSLHQPRLFSSTQSSSNTQEKFNFPEGLTEFYVLCTMNKKPLLLLHFLLRLKYNPVLCFTNSRDAAHRLFMLVKLYGGVEVAEFSSRLSPGERQKTLKRFEQGKIQLLISSDAAARGIDIKGVKCVINYDAPQYSRTYIHRVGRTARAGNAGVAFSFVLGVQEKLFVQMVKDVGSPSIQKQTVKPESLRGMEKRYEEVLAGLGKAIMEEKTKKRL